jgi:hypothetical protein
VGMVLAAAGMTRSLLSELFCAVGWPPGWSKIMRSWPPVSQRATFRQRGRRRKMSVITCLK